MQLVNMYYTQDPKMYYTTTKKKGRKLKKTKPKKNEEFRLGEIRSWKECVNMGSMEEGDPGVENTWFKGKVYSRRSKKTQIIDIVKGKEVMGEITLEDTDIGECLEDEDHWLECCQSQKIRHLLILNQITKLCCAKKQIRRKIGRSQKKWL